MQKSVELCEKVWNFSIASHTTTLENFFYSDFALRPNSFEPFATIFHPRTSVDNRKNHSYTVAPLHVI